MLYYSLGVPWQGTANGTHNICFQGEKGFNLSWIPHFSRAI